MLASTAQFATMVASRSQVIAFGVSIDLPTDGLYPGGALFPGSGLFPAPALYANDVAVAVTAFEIDASIDTDMPAGTRLEEGFSATQGTFTLAGHIDPTDPLKTVGWLFSRYAYPAADGSLSPLARMDVLYRPVTISLGLYPDGSAGVPELLTKLVGLVEDYGLDADGNVAFTVIDLRQQFRGAVDMPAVVTAPPYNAGLTNEFVVDAVLRQATAGAVSSWPAQRASCVLAAGFRSSLWPEVGTPDVLAGDPAPVFAPGVFGTALSLTKGFAGFQATANITYFEFLLTGLGGSGCRVENGTISWDISSTGVTAHVAGSFVGLWAGTINSSAHWIGIKITGSGAAGTLASTFYLDGTPHVLYTSTSGTERSTSFAIYGVTSSAVGTVEALCATTETSPTPRTSFTPRAVLDPSLNPLDIVPGIIDQDQWQVIQSLAASELAVAGFEGNIFRYRNRNTLRTSASVLAITSDQALNNIEQSSSAAAVVNRARIGWTPWTFATVATTLWTAAKAHKVPAHGTWSMTVTLDGLATQIDETAAVLPDFNTDVAHSKFRASTDRNGTDEHGGVVVGIAQTGGNAFTITATNSTGSAAWLVSPSKYTDMPAGTPLLRIAGVAVTSGDEQTTDYQWPLAADGGAAGSRFGEIVYQLSGNPWIQDEDTAQQLALDIITASSSARPDLLNIDIAPDPRLERCDRVQIVDSERTGTNEYALIFGYGISYAAPSEQGGAPTFSMNIDARAVTAPGGWLLGVAGRSRLGVSTYLP